MTPEKSYTYRRLPPQLVRSGTRAGSSAPLSPSLPRSRPAFASNDPISMTNPAASGATPAPADAAKGPAPTPTAGTPTPPPPRRGPGHRGQDVRDAVAEMAARAHEISLEAGSKMAAAMKDVINAAAGLTSFALESARDLVQYMVRRGQMTQDEADKLIREAEEAHGKKNPGFVPPPRRTDHPL